MFPALTLWNTEYHKMMDLWVNTHHTRQKCTWPVSQIPYFLSPLINAQLMAYRGRHLLKMQSRRLCTCGEQQACLCSQCEFCLPGNCCSREAVHRHPLCAHLCQLWKPPPLVSSLVLLGTVPILDHGGWLVLPQLLHIPLVRLVQTVDKLLVHHLPPLWHGVIKPLSPAPWPLVLCLCPTTGGHCPINVLGPELSTVFPCLVWPHSQARLRNIDSKPFLTQLILTKKAWF